MCSCARRERGDASLVNKVSVARVFGVRVFGQAEAAVERFPGVMTTILVKEAIRSNASDFARTEAFRLVVDIVRG